MSEVTYTQEQVEAHNSVDDLWVIYNGAVYDVTKYIDEHPGGEEVIADVGGQDATEAFNDIGHSDDAHEILEKMKIGLLEGGVVKKVTTAQSRTSEGGGSNSTFIILLVILVAIGAYYYLNQ